MSRLKIALKALRQLGPLRLGENGLYRLGLVLNLWKTPVPPAAPAFPLDLKALPSDLSCFPDACEGEPLLQEAREILSGQVRLFGGPPLALQLAPSPPLRPWVDYERGRAAWGVEDVKFIWEPARFGWAVTLARAYHMTGDEAFASGFWRHLETFLAANPPYLGPNWTSGQEVALRLVVWAFVLPTLAASPTSTPARLEQLAQAIAQHAARIPPTLLYARSQDNNHLLSEAAGLYTAAILLPGHPSAASWRRTGWTWFNRALQRQIEPDGAYIQQSLNYHRLMLQLAVWVDALARQQGDNWPPLSRERLSAATRWLLARLDPDNGRAPNFGHNDGAYLFPFGPFCDQRPVAQAAARLFSYPPFFKGGQGGILRTSAVQQFGANTPPESILDSSGIILRAPPTWATLRTTHFSHRPGQADQLHLDLWHAGRNILLDPGTYRYNAPPPWDNALAGAAVHNAVTVDGCEPMTRAGRFLWLDWDQCEVIRLTPHKVVAQRSGYRKLGLVQRRTLECQGPHRWQVTDELQPAAGHTQPHDLILHWLFPDGDWAWVGGRLRLASLGLEVTLTTSGSAPVFQLIRAGELIYGTGATSPVLGWYSPTYASREPALSLRVMLRGVTLPVGFVTSFHFQ